MAWIEKRGKKYRVRWDEGTAENRRKRAESFDSRDEADQFKKKIEYELSIGTYVYISKMTFGEFLDHWLKYHRENIEPKTLDSYKCEIKNHIKPNLGDIKLAKLAPLHLQEYYFRLQSEGRANTLRRQIEIYQQEQKHKNATRAKARLEKMIQESRCGLSNTTINYHHSIIRKALKQAYKWQMVARNIADAVEPPKKDNTEINYIKRNDLNKFIKAIENSPFSAIYMTAIFTGMRQGEILGLRWQDIDFDEGIIHVRQQLQYISGKGYFFKSPKQKSVRDIPMPLPLNAVFRKTHKDQFKIRKIYGEEYIDHDLLFCATNGHPLSRSLITRNLQKTLKTHGFGHIRFHALRHTFATMARGAGVPMEDIQDLLGHADISTTKNMYTHVEIEPLRDSMKKLTDFLDL